MATKLTFIHNPTIPGKAQAEDWIVFILKGYKISN